MIPVRLKWQRCRDGVDMKSGVYREVTDDLPNGQVHVYTSGDKLFVPRSDRFEDVTYRVADLENPIVLHFINCFELGGGQPEAYGAFLSRFGMPKKEPEAHIAEIDDLANVFTVGLALSTNTENTSNRARDANHFLKSVRLTPAFEFGGSDGGQLVLQPDNLLGFMAMEVALAHEAGAALTSCSHCKRFYLTGPLTGRRSHSRYCSDRCRVAAMRKRNADRQLDQHH